MKKVWIDLTDFSVWSGHLTGVQRVIYEVLLRLKDDSGIELHGFIYIKERNEIFIADPIKMLEKVEVVSRDDVPLAQNNRLKSMARSLYFGMPQFAREKITPRQKEQLIRISKKTIQKSRKAINASRSLVKAAKTENLVRAEIHKKDTVLVLGKIWDETELVDFLSIKHRNIGFKYVQLIYDLIPVIQPHLFGYGLFNPYSQYLFETLASVDTILCDSMCTETDVINLAKRLNFSKPNTCVIELGDTPMIKSKGVKPDFINENEPFILSVGTIEVRKNHALLYQSWKLAKENNKEFPRLVIVGSKGWLTDDFLYVNSHDPDTKNVITTHGNIPDDQLKWLYENCLFTLYPSIYEGWGLPIAESLAYGKVCIPSSASSMPEIAGDLLDYISPYDSRQLMELVEKYLEPKIRRQKESEIRKEYKQRSWDKTAAKVRDSL